MDLKMAILMRTHLKAFVWLAVSGFQQACLMEIVFGTAQVMAELAYLAAKRYAITIGLAIGCLEFFPLDFSFELFLGQKKLDPKARYNCTALNQWHNGNQKKTDDLDYSFVGKNWTQKQLK